MKKFILVILFLTLCVPAYATDYYVLDGGSSSNCTSWSDACDQIATAENLAARGDTIYVGDGEYTNVTFNTATSGTTVITVKKATSSSHGTETGWQASYGDGQAVISGGVNLFSTSYWVFDGQTRTTETSGHGFKIIGLATSNQYGISVNGVDNITIRYTEITSPSTPIVDGCAANNTCTRRGLHALSGTDYLTFEYGYIHDINVPVMMVFDNSNFVFRYNVIARNDSTPETHSEAFSISYGTKSDFYIYNNKFIDIEGTAFIAVMNETNLTNFYVYNNISYYTTDAIQTGLGNGWLTCTNSGTVCTNFYIYNNTMTNLPMGISSKIDIGSGGTASNWNVKNNLWYCNTGSCSPADNDVSAEITYDNNWYGGVDYNASENGAINGSSEDPFTNSATYDFTLKSEATTIGAATDLSALFTIDYSGATRSSWDIGAYEYSGEDTTPPDATYTGGIFGGCVFQ